MNQSNILNLNQNILLENKLKLLNEMPNPKSNDQYVEKENLEQVITNMYNIKAKGAHIRSQ